MLAELGIVVGEGEATARAGVAAMIRQLSRRARDTNELISH
jgi:hypothetical protein